MSTNQINPVHRICIPFGPIRLLRDWSIKLEYFYYYHYLGKTLLNGILVPDIQSGTSKLEYYDYRLKQIIPLPNSLVIPSHIVPCIHSIKKSKSMNSIGLKFFKKYGNSCQSGLWLKIEALNGLEYQEYV